MNRLSILVALSLLLGLAACKSGGSGPKCEFKDGAVLSTSSWPKFRHDTQNTGTIQGVTLAAEPTVHGTFVAPAPIGNSPVLGNGTVPGEIDRRVYLGLMDGQLLAIESDPDTGGNLEPIAEFAFSADAPVRSTPLVTTRAGAENLFFGADDGTLHAVNAQGDSQPDYWPFSIGSIVTASPALNGIDGTIFSGSFDRKFVAVCPNGFQRFAITTDGSIESSPAFTAKDINLAIFGGGDRYLHALRSDAYVMFTVSTAAPVRNAPVVEIDSHGTSPATVAIYTVDESGRLLKTSPNGRPVYSIQLWEAPTTTPDDLPVPSPALAGNHLYVSDPDNDLLRVIDTANGSLVWSLPVAMPGPPVVAQQGTTRTVVVPADGFLLFVQDLGDGPGESFAAGTGAQVLGTPAIRRYADGSGGVYAATADQQLLLLR